ncbi:bifunctional diguanylate cyclase/phosphodiesterase [Thiomicrorhabdus sp. 6S3-12]|uniref:putative bifunctional diguanylate cyclase/phosphodiesterase n=1 Tax=Thiomicrorhabdus sp. 6S3-12 TaxID=2819681 RepID=UPI001AAC57F2|nr:GGDEF domain-containing phosphodiesterase [Thiomicrorhabdus sp. 6S3-12]MBO1923469.1 EAL domain-containing protein [Thiomicrorhabdus sp. 6S3-12]
MLLRNATGLPSLRKRYISLTIFLGLFVASVVAFGYFQTSATKNAVSRGYDGVLQEQASLEEVRNHLLVINKDINLFLLDPQNENLIKEIDSYTEQSLKSLNQLVNSRHDYHVELISEVNPIIDNFAKLNREVKRLIEYRLDINKQYPAMGISANEMEGQQSQVNSGFELLILEIESGSLELKSSELYPLLLKSQTLWSKTISQSRIYMTNRLASFTTEILEQQGQSLGDMFLVFESNIRRLKELYSKENSFEGTAILDSIQKVSEAWFVNFLEMRVISETGQWRSDTVLMKNSVLPLVNDITQGCNDVEAIIKREKKFLDEELSRSDDSFKYLIYGIIALYLIVISSILMSMEWSIFKPIERVTQALRSRAFGMDMPKIDTTETEEIARLVEAFVQMDEEVTHRQNALEHQAMHDHLTGLPNRFLLNQRIEYQLLSAERQQGSFVLFVMDLDFFKEINDTLGHASGDKLLIEASERIHKLIRKSDTLARLGGDEFSILLPDMHKKQAGGLAEQIIEQIGQPFELNGEKVNVSISIGIVSYPDDGMNAETLLQYADMAMYAAKRKRIGYSQYDSSENIYSKERLSLVGDLIDALDNDQFELHYQPQVAAESGRICGAEALLRWQHKEHGYVPPDKIIEMAERLGIIHKLSLYVLRKAIAECRHWHRQGSEVSVSVNLSVRDLANEQLCTQIREYLNEFGLDYRYLTVEITESVMMENLALSLGQLKKLNKLGINISIDDFGTGFSSLAYLKRLPVNELKIDKSFIMEIDEDENDQQIVSSTINLGHSLGLKVVAEGVETQRVLDMIKDFGCDQIQGYFISKPLPAPAFRQLLKNASRGA